MSYTKEYDELRAAGLSDEQIRMYRNTGATHAAILLEAKRLNTTARISKNWQTATFATEEEVFAMVDDRRTVVQVHGLQLSYADSTFTVRWYEVPQEKIGL